MVDFRSIYVEPPKGKVPKYIGVWTHGIDALRSALINVEELKKIGVNTIIINPDVELAESGNIDTVPDEAFIFYVHAFHRSGLRVLLIIDPMHPSFVRWGRYEWEKPDPGADVKRGPQLLEKFTPLVLEWAEIAERYGVEIYATVNEVEKLVWTPGDASKWLEQIQPELRKRYHGKIAVKLQAFNPLIQDLWDLGFQGYDYIIASGFLGWSYDEEIWQPKTKDLINRALSYAKRDGCQGVFISDWGAYLGGNWSEPISSHQIANESTQKEVFEFVFREAWDKVDGIFPATCIGWDFLGRPAEQVFKSWCTKDRVLEPCSIDKVWKTPGLLKLIEKALSARERPCYLWCETNDVEINQECPGPGSCTNIEDCDRLAFYNEEYCERWLEERGKEPYGSNLFVLDLDNPWGIIIDGRSSDWQGIEAVCDDTSGDAPSSDQDVKAFYVECGHQYLYLMIEFFDENPGLEYNVHLDVGLDGIEDYVVMNRVHGADVHKPPPNFVGHVKNAYGEVVELKIPLDMIENPRKVGIRISSLDENHQPVDWCGEGWHQVDLAELSRVSSTPD